MQIEALARKLDKKVRELEEKREELRKVHRDWEDIFQSIGYPTIILDAQYNILSVNKATVKAVGSHSAEELIGRKCYEIFHNTSEPPATCPFTKMFSSSKLEERYMDVEALGGVFHVSCTPVFDEMGNIQKIIHIATDITERKRAEDALRISEEKFRILFENAPLGIGVSTLEGKLLAYNEVISEITGYTKEDLLNFNVINLYQNPEDRKALLKELQSNGYVRNYEVLLKRKDGIPFYANITINMITVDGKNAL
ncbi:MAG: PAS domain S-box protein, partial [Nitrospira sp.]|nr:PAS domain S-box protein [Nitrospira sp.]